MKLTELISLFRPKQDCSVALLWEEDRVSWMRYTAKLDNPVTGTGNWREMLRAGKDNIKQVRVVAAGRRTYYGLAPVELQDLDSRIPFDSGCYQLRTVAVPGVGSHPESKFFAVACNSLISEITGSLAEFGLKLSSLEVPATALARRSATLKICSKCLLQVHIGFRFTQFLVSFRGSPYVAREFAFGLDDLQNQYATHLQLGSGTAAKELEAHSVHSAGPVEPAVVKLLEQASRTVSLFSERVDCVSVIGPGWLRGLEFRLAEHLGAHPLFGDAACRTSAPLLLEMTEQ